MKNDSRKGFGIAGAIALGVAAVTALVAVTKKKSGKPKQKRSIYKPELIKLPLKSDTEPVRRRTEPKESYIRVEDPYDYVEEDLYTSTEDEISNEKPSFFNDVEVSYDEDDIQKDSEIPVTITDVVEEEVYVSEDQEIIIEAVMVGKPEAEVMEAEPVDVASEEPVVEPVDVASEAVTIEAITVGREESDTEPVVEEVAVTEEPVVEETIVMEEPVRTTWNSTPEPVIEFFEDEDEIMEDVLAEEETPMPKETIEEVPTVEEAVVEEPVVEEVPVVEEPVVEEVPVVEEPAEEPPVAEETVEEVQVVEEAVEEIPVVEEIVEEEVEEPVVKEIPLMPHERYYDWIYNVDEHYNVRTDGSWVYCLSDEILESTSVNKKGGKETINIADTFKNKITTRGYCLLKYIGSERDVVIPSMINGLPVVAAMNTFRSNQTIKKVTIPASMEALRRTFYSCYHLDKIVFEEGTRLVYELDAIMCGNNDMDSGTESTTVVCTADIIEYFKRHYKLGCPVVFKEIK